MRPAIATLGLLALACGTSSSGRSEGPVPSPSTAAPVMPSFPADANVFHGAVVNIALPSRNPGVLTVDVESHQSVAGTTVTVRAIRQVDCHVDKADPGAALFVCDTKWRRQKVVPQSAFTFDGLLGTASLTTTVDGKPLTVTWTGYGTPRQQVNENGALLARHRDAKAVATWGRVRHTDPDGAKAPSLVYHRVTART